MIKPTNNKEKNNIFNYIPLFTDLQHILDLL